ncbi:uncharacterized protein LOC129943390 [Eupeodes corollae]|uniref:uncharacterized protein LOC129943390 n=1 Tax=Eupeodes corollae TaxID=290404 RepID=UPI00249171F6|nr:uncharacterized protein LOC129943390 [Eupeodes corollae]
MESAIDTLNHQESDDNINIITKILQRKKVYNDDADLSAHPSYSEFKDSYKKRCALRYRDNCIKYEKQFQRELTQMSNHQPTAYEAARFTRHFCKTTLWPRLHNHEEIDYFQRQFFKMTSRQKKRLNFLMNTKLI